MHEDAPVLQQPSRVTGVAVAQYGVFAAETAIVCRYAVGDGRIRQSSAFSGFDKTAFNRPLHTLVHPPVLPMRPAKTLRSRNELLTHGTKPLIFYGF
jgi:hypothetical protein